MISGMCQDFLEKILPNLEKLMKKAYEKFGAKSGELGLWVFLFRTNWFWTVVCNIYDSSDELGAGYSYAVAFSLYRDWNITNFVLRFRRIKQKYLPKLAR
jgi:hypothetical protein